MLALIQLVTFAEVHMVNEARMTRIEKGILALIGLEKTDTFENGKKLLNKILAYRIFPDSDGKTNLCLKDIQGGFMLVPQFTLVAETQSGTRPGFSKGMNPNEGKILFEQLVSHAKHSHSPVEAGVFGTYMKINLCNDGPMTFILSA